MRVRLSLAVLLATSTAALVLARQQVSLVIPATGGDITVIPITHGTLELTQGNHAVLIDPARFGPGEPPPMPPPPPPSGGGRSVAPPFDPSNIPVTAAQKARFSPRPPTLILVTDIHEDHLDPRMIEAVRTKTTAVVLPGVAAKNVPGAVVIANGETKTADGLTIEAVPMYNLKPDPEFKQIFHTKGRGNGYVVTLGGKRIYIAGDTACTPEMKALKNIDVAFLPMNLPFTMSPKEAAECAAAFKPKIVYPYHYFGEDVKAFAAALKGTGIEVRQADWYVGVRPPQH